MADTENLELRSYTRRNLGANVIEAAVVFQYAAASIISSQADLMDKLLLRNESSNMLLEANDKIYYVLNSIGKLQNAIVDEIEDGMDIGKQI